MIVDASRVRAAGLAATAAIAAFLASACTPTVRVVAPSEPITINLNIHIDQQIRVQMDHEITELIDENPDLF